MAGEVQVKGAEQLEQLGKTLKQNEQTELRQELRRNLRLALKPTTKAMRASLLAGLPKRGGLNKFFATSSMNTSVRSEGRDVGVRILASKKGHDLAAVDKGEVRHPVFGRRKSWTKQRVASSLVSKPFEAARPGMQLAVMRAMDATAHKITR